MTGWKHNSILHKLLGSFSVALLFALIVSVSSPRLAAAQSTASGGGTVAAIAADDDPADNIDRPAPPADYDRPAEASGTGPVPDAEPADASDDRVLELPQVINPTNYAAVSYAPASHVPVPASSSADDADGSADPPDVVVSNPPSDSQSDPDDQSLEASVAGDADDAQSYADQNNNCGGGPVVVYAAPVYVPTYPATSQANPLPQPYMNTNHLPMYSALSSRTLPMYSGLAAVTPGRYHVNGGSRLWNSPLGQGFGMARGSMMGGFSHGR
jgi:hypothetical protein